MNNEEFTLLLNEIIQKPQTDDTTLEFLSALIKGYNDNLGLKMLHVYLGDREKRFCQIIFVGDPDKKILLCFTSSKYFKQAKLNPEFNGEDTKTELFSCRQVINNMMHDDSIDSIAFNPFTDNCYCVLKSYIKLAIEKNLFTLIE
ncbi:MAG: hypothetical protein ACI4KB_06105 [Oscillospiraceae bacterium]